MDGIGVAILVFFNSQPIDPMHRCFGGRIGGLAGNAVKVISLVLQNCFRDLVQIHSQGDARQDVFVGFESFDFLNLGVLGIAVAVVVVFVFTASRAEQFV